MYKRLSILVLVMALAIGIGIGCAGDVEAVDLNTEAKVTLGVTDVNVGTFYEIDGALLVGVLLPVVSYDFISLDIGVLTSISEDLIPIGSVGIDVKKLAAKLGWEYNLLDPFKVGIWYGKQIEDRTTTVNHKGIYATITFPL